MDPPGEYQAVDSGVPFVGNVAGYKRVPKLQIEQSIAPFKPPVPIVPIVGIDEEIGYESDPEHEEIRFDSDPELSPNFTGPIRSIGFEEEQDLEILTNMPGIGSVLRDHLKRFSKGNINDDPNKKRKLHNAQPMDE